MAARLIMIQGTGSSVGKSVITAALCAYFRREGHRVAPFKSQNMSNNAFVTATGGEIGRAQAFQAQACGIEPTVEMNPILLKPSSEIGAQVVVLGKAAKTMSAREYHAAQPSLLGVIRDSLEKLRAQYEVIVIEGAGSPAEVNLRDFDIVNMAVARMAGAPVVLVGDISLGGVFASLVGTLELLTDEERSMVKGLLINKFRGDLSLLYDGLEFLEGRTKKKVLGVLPFLPDLLVAEEDAISEVKWKRPVARDPQKLAIEVILLPHISNSTDFESFETEPDVALRFLARVSDADAPLPDVLILPGSKSTMADLGYLRLSGFAEYVERCRSAQVPVIGLCGGYQMLGKELLDPDGVESESGYTRGLGLLEVKTVFEREKKTVQVRAIETESEEEISGYEIHMGRTEGPGTARPVCRIVAESGEPANRCDGARSEDGLVWGSYIHGIFDAPGFRREFLNALRRRRGWAPRASTVNDSGAGTFDLLDEWIRKHVQMSLLDDVLHGRM